MTHMHGYRVRIYPTKELEELIWKHIGCCRYMWNYMLNLQEERYKAGEKHLSKYDTFGYITKLKKDGEHDWLGEVSHTSLQRTLADLDNAYNGYFKKVFGLPTFKSKKDKNKSYPVCDNRFHFLDEKYCRVQKLGKVRYKTDLKFEFGYDAKFSDVRISFDNGKWYVSFCMERENQTHELTDKSMGIDLGIKRLAVVHCGDEDLYFKNINKTKKIRDLEEKIKSIQKRISRKYELNKVDGKYVKTNNIKKEEDKVRKLYHRIVGIRTDYIHQITHQLVMMLPKRVVMEDLDVLSMMKNKHMSKAAADQNLFEFRRIMKYKCENNGIEFVLADRYFPSSKTCSCCGNIKRDLKLSDRVYKCSICGKEFDRDDNAAINLSKYESHNNDS